MDVIKIKEENIEYVDRVRREGFSEPKESFCQSDGMLLGVLPHCPQQIELLQRMGQTNT